MPTLNGADGSLQLFLSGFAARDIAESLASFDETTSADSIRAAMQAQRLDVAGIRKSGAVAGWVVPDDLVEHQESVHFRPFDAASVLADTASLNEVVQGLDAASHLFVRSFGQVSGLICRRDLQKPAMRMWLFGLVTITELRVTRMIDEYCPQDSWRQYLSEGRLQKASELQAERNRRGQQRTLLDCLQFADKGQIVARDDRLRERTRFSSKRKVEEFVNALQDLRNNLAHSQDLTGDWEVIRDLAGNLHRIVLGPEETVQP
jgi:hypothetical protein